MLKVLQESIKQSLNFISLRVHRFLGEKSTQGFIKLSYKHLTEKLYVFFNLEI